MDIQLLEDTFSKIDSSMKWMRKAFALMILLVGAALVVCIMFLVALWDGSLDGPNGEEVRAQHNQIIDSVTIGLDQSRTIIYKLDSLNYGK